MAGENTRYHTIKAFKQMHYSYRYSISLVLTAGVSRVLKSPVPSSSDPYPATLSASLELPGDVACRSGSDRLCLTQRHTTLMLHCNIIDSNRYRVERRLVFFKG